MSKNLPPEPVLRDLLELCYEPSQDLSDLRTKVQLAIQVEFATIPAYSTALYSIKDTTSDTYRLIRSVLIEEMFHTCQAANLLVAIGGQPIFTGAAVPEYPTYLPNADQDKTPFVGLRKASVSVIKNTFMRIEKPAPVYAPAQGDQFQTIGQFYKAVTQDLERLTAEMGESEVFRQAPGAEQRTDYYLGKGGGKLLEITNLEQAKAAITAIVEQGEGAVNPTHTLVPKEPYGAYNHYGERTDGTFGPILGTPMELSHYFKFKAIADGVTPFPETWPLVAVVNSEHYQKNAQALNHQFNTLYSIMLKGLEYSFRSGEKARNCYFQIVLPLMHQNLPTLARKLMKTPIWNDSTSDLGPNAAPTFEYVPTASLLNHSEGLYQFRQDATSHSNPKVTEALLEDLDELIDLTRALQSLAAEASIEL